MAIKKYNPTSPARRFMTVQILLKSLRRLRNVHFLQRRIRMPEETLTVESQFVTEAAVISRSTEL